MSNSVFKQIHYKQIHLICVLPSLGKRSMQLRTRLVYSMECNLKFCEIKVIFQSPCKLHLLFHYNDSLQKKIRSDIVYRYMCSNCKLLIMVKHTATFLLELQSTWVFLILLESVLNVLNNQQCLTIYLNVTVP